ncbi:MAG: ABC transporter substrate-binding protein [Niameybacter sp.]|uniref:ABC transporter substrate-binding protein n=1 Tax=Niameybacter sp. TaxID=2033640 RepID=UPI002FCA5C51
MKRFMCLVLGMSLLVGCSSQTPNTGQAVTEQPPVETTKLEDAAEEGSVTVVDQLGREVTIEGDVERIVSSYYIASSMLIALDAKDKVVGLEMKADTREIYKQAAPEFLELPAVGSGKTFNVEEALALKPDLIILPYRLESFIPQIEALDIPVIAVEPESMENFLECIELVGSAIGHEAEADKLLNYFNGVTEKVSGLTKDLEVRPSVYLAGSSNPLVTCTGLMYQNDLIELAGGENVTKDLTDPYWQTISNEELLGWNPEYMYAVSYADYDLAAISEESNYQEIQAVKEGRVKYFPSSLEPWDYPTPSAALGVLWLLNDLHPDLYSKEAYVEDAKDFYQTFYGIEVSKEALGL